MSVLLFNQLNAKFCYTSSSPNSVNTCETCENTVSPNKITPPDSINTLNKCPLIYVYAAPTFTKTGSDLTLKAVYPKINASSLITRKLDDLVRSNLNIDNSINLERRFIDITPPQPQQPDFLQCGFKKYRDTNEPASRLTNYCNGLSNKKWDTS